MKKIFLFTTLISGFAVLSAFKTAPILKNHSNDYSSTLQQQQQQQTVDAYVMWGGNWRRGQITYSSTQQGYKPISYQFEDYGNSQLRGQFFPDQIFSPLNPNNQLAKQNNWTHTISVGGATAYLTLY